MRRIALLIALALCTPAAAADPFPLIAPAVEAAIARGEFPGAVVVVVHADAVVYRRAFGLRAKEPAAVPMTADAVFDMASLTKPVATATSVMALVERGQLRLQDPVAKFWPEFAANGKAGVTVEHCLLHTSGLTADNAEADYAAGRPEAMKRIAALKLEAPAGSRFRYSDVGFIVLGELVERVAKQPLDEFAKTNVFAPLKMADTGYRPAESLRPRVAPTGKRDGKIIQGNVHDPRAFGLAGVAGHAGLFGTADDLARYARMLLRGGELDGVRVLSPLTVKLFTDPVRVPPDGVRSRGWDVDTSFSAPRGDLFPAGDGFGHTGFTGTSIWIDPPSRTAIIILTSRLHPNEKGNATPVRRQVATLVAAGIADAAPRVRRPQPGTPGITLAGIDVLAAEKFARLAGRRVGLVTNHTGRAADGTPTIDLLAAAPGVKLVALFSPEHGIRGEKDEKVGDGTDTKTGLPVFSLYGDRRKPTADTLKGIDTLVYDIQDIGCRFYTYISTLGLVLEAAKENNIRVVVLDRPNPIGGVRVEGPVADPGRESFVAYHSLPVRHGMTVGELAKMFNAERGLNADLDIVPVKNWRRADGFDRTGLTWVNPSPNMRHLSAAVLYPGIGLLELTNVSVGRGTERPFEWLGAPYIDGRKLAADLARRPLAGVRFVPVSRTPNASVHKEKLCGGVDIIIDDWQRVEPVAVGLAVASSLRALYPAAWETKNFDRLLVSKATADAVLAGTPPADISATWADGLAKFRGRRANFLLYPE